MYWALALTVWYAITTLAAGGADGRSLTRIVSAIAQLVAFTAALVSFSRIENSLHVLWRYVGIIGAVYLVVSNLLAPQLGFSLHYLAFERYEGLVGANQHGLLSAIVAMSLLNLTATQQGTTQRRLLVPLLVLSVANLWATGSRLSLITFLVFLFLRAQPRQRKLAMFLLLPPAALIVAEIAREWETVKPLLRLDEYHFYGRLNPLLWAWETSLSNQLLPLGPSALTEERAEQRLDSSFLVILIEAGLIGLLIVLGMILSTVRRGYLLEADEANPDARAARTTFIALCVHGLGENTLLTGSNLATWIFWISAAFLHAEYWKRWRR
ncbi:MAG: hypothetical protein RMK92_02615 [Armatimonadota bacterium]|nr:hypothetical protein [Armatimonadota bacterium]